MAEFSEIPQRVTFARAVVTDLGNLLDAPADAADEWKARGLPAEALDPLGRALAGAAEVLAEYFEPIDPKGAD